MSKQLRKYQKESKSAIMQKLSEGVSSQMLVLPTGTGKTFTAAQITDEFERVLWLTHTEELIDQSALSLIMNLSENYQEVEKVVEDRGGMFEFLNFAETNPMMLSETEKWIAEHCGIIKASRMDTDRKITIASIQTIHRRLGKIDPNTFDIFVIDEAHMSGANTFVKTVEHFNPKLLLGLTATPYRSDGTSLGKIFDEIAYEYKMIDAVREGFLCEIDAIKVKTNVSLDKVRTTAGELNQKDLDNYVNCPERNNLIVDSYEKYAKEKQGIIFCVNVQHALDLHATFNNRGYSKVDYVVGDKTLCPNRKERIRDFKKGRTQILINVMVLTTGFDHPNVGWIGMACPTKSLVKYLQCVGRGTRLKDKTYVDKFGQKVTILDFVDVTSRHRLINAWNLDREVPVEDRVFTTLEKKEKLIAYRQKVLDSNRDKDERVDLLRLPRVSVSKSKKMKEPATYKQLMYLKGLGYDVKENFYSKFDASIIISAQPASPAQIYRLKKEGYDISRGVTKGEASLAISDVERRREEKVANAKEQLALQRAENKLNNNKLF